MRSKREERKQRSREQEREREAKEQTFVMSVSTKKMHEREN